MCEIRDNYLRWEYLQEKTILKTKSGVGIDEIQKAY